ncbi:MAG: type III-B CRISPR module RAMP protein Cmr6 [Acidobacteria bacterium]|nr:type III-B CRISPR module RAMP protein Cmr6 [Acidobacteriota bacterium]
MDQYRQPDSTAHAGLWLDKFICSQTDAQYTDKPRKSKRTPKSRLVDEVAGIGESVEYKAFYRRWEESLERLEKEKRLKKRLARVQGRMAVGLGDEGVLETSVTLHRTYGVPYIPGSALKGLAASFARNKLKGDWAKGTFAYNVVFGKTDEAGYITFYDALYKPGSGHKGKALYPDGITVHHEKYYKGEAAPADWDDPVPVPFLSATGEYLIALSAPPGCELWIGKTFELLKLALEHEGIGAKTSSGYGRMELSDK